MIIRTSNKEFTINKNKVVEITLGTTEIYAGIKELGIDTASIVLGLDKDKVEGVVPGRISAGFYFTFIIALLSIAIIIILFFIYRALKKQKLASTPVPRIQQYRQFPGQLPSNLQDNFPLKRNNSGKHKVY